LLDFPRSVDDLFNRFWGGLAPVRAHAWQPAVDVIETPQAYVLRVEIPGIDPDLVDVTLTRDSLTIRGEKRAEERTEGKTCRLGERLHGAFERTFTLPTAIATEDVEAEARHGVLTIRVMKAKEAQPHRISIRKG
jgi:HSP20 family protein